ncbi:hypothetical protein A8C75_01270 [Marinobacterium aestuarii]|uniref:Uncharacterized protein n=1 Tax=Marinobacterium aestuarii TaxID=1821621 RepID=A0A1A9ETW4_9GAMM|nr:glycosyltransferase family 29 protein [Marinobacterium aestuarii]ANG61222.1 hypothetical protein A8C75_01270 [Marinobacterium aestuarii]
MYELESKIELLKNFVAGKSVLIVGNSESIFGLGLGDKIDSFDVVVRMNLGRVKKPFQQGTRTDVLFTSVPKLSESDIVSWFDPKWVVWATSKRDRVPEFRNINDRLIYHPMSYWEELYETQAPSRPSTGLIAINFFSNHCACASVSYIGFDFFETDTFYHKKRFGLLRKKLKTPRPHDGDSEKKFISDLEYRGKLFRLS